jgi:hypothetical protein
VMRHNLEWFGHHLWTDPLPDWTQPEVPKKETKPTPAGGGAEGGAPTP